MSLLMLGIRIRARRGIVLMISMITLVLVTMLVGAVFTLLPTQLAASDHEGQSVLAVAACASGGDYAQSRLQFRPTWKGDMDGTGTMRGYTVNTAALQIYEDKGNVLGLMTQGDGSKTAFRIRFNYQNGGSTTPDDGFVDPIASHFIRIPQVSFNNLGVTGYTNPPLYTAAASGNYPVNAAPVPADTLPRFSSVIFVEGLSGPGLSKATFTGATGVSNLDALAGQRDVVSRVAQVRMGFLNQSRVDAAVYAGGDFKATATCTTIVPGTNNTQLVSAPSTAAANLRALANATAEDSTTALVGADASSRVYHGGTDADFLTHNISVANSSVNPAAQESHWLKIKWSEIAKASAADATRVKAGTYLWEQDPAGAVGTPRLMYYPEEHTTTGAFVPSTAGTEVTGASVMATGTGLNLDKAQMMVNITEKVYVEPVSAGAVKAFSVIIDPAFQASKTIRPWVNMDPDSSNTKILSAEGTVLLEGKLEGLGSVTTGGNLTIQGTSIFEADQTDALVLYAKKDIAVTSVPPTVAQALAPDPGIPAPSTPPGMNGMGRANGWGRHNQPNPPPPPQTAQLEGDVQFAGAVFAMGNVTTDITDGGFYMRGVLSAYGGDPEDANPALRSPGAVAGTGVIDVKASRVEFMYDPSYLMTSGNLGSPAYLDRISWNLLP